MAYKQQKSIIKGTDAHRTAISEANSPAKHWKASVSHMASHAKDVAGDVAATVATTSKKAQRGIKEAYKSTKKNIQKGYKHIKNAPVSKISGKVLKKVAGPAAIYFTAKEGYDLIKDIRETGSLKEGFKKHVAEDYGIGDYESDKKTKSKNYPTTSSQQRKSWEDMKGKLEKKTKSKKTKSKKTKSKKTKIKKTKSSSSSKTSRGLDMTNPYNRAYVKGKQMGYDLNDLVRQRKLHKKGSDEYATIQNKINRAYGVSKRH